jgi:hypothetical protein
MQLDIGNDWSHITTNAISTVEAKHLVSSLILVPAATYEIEATRAERA